MHENVLLVLFMILKKSGLEIGAHTKIWNPRPTPSGVLNNGTPNKKSAVIFPEERGYIAGRARLYCQKSAVIWRKSAVIFPEERGYIFVMQIVATFAPLGPKSETVTCHMLLGICCKNIEDLFKFFESFSLCFS